MTRLEVTKSILYALYLFIVLHLVFISGNDHRHLDLFNFSHLPSFFPFIYKIDYFTTLGFTRFYDSKFFLKEVFGNLLLLSPLTIILMLVEGYDKVKRIVLLAFLTSFFIETIQFISGIGSADIDDLILNTAGAWLAVPFVRWIRKNKFWLQLDKLYHISGCNQAEG